eukprot:4880686-Amphidinium_carterae.2
MRERQKRSREEERGAASGDGVLCLPEGGQSEEVPIVWKWARLESEQQRLQQTTARERLEQKPQTRVER